MASPSPIPPYKSALYHDFYCELGGSFYPENEDFFDGRPDHKAQDEQASLQRWIHLQTKTVSDAKMTLEERLYTAIQKWAREQIETLQVGKKHCKEMIEITSRRSNRADSYELLKTVEKEFDEVGDSVVFEESGDFVLVDDGADRKISLLQQWQQQPAHLIEALPRVKAAFASLKGTQRA